jgi:branched-chain amino acid aminotransferase
MFNVVYLDGIKVNSANNISLYNSSFLYGINCFEGIRAYWNDSVNCLTFFDLNEHLDRLFDSAKFMNFNNLPSKEELINLLNEIEQKEKISFNIYVRITFFINGETSWSDQENISYIISLRSMNSELGYSKPVSLLISKFLRISSNSMPPSIKAGANYLNSRYALLESISSNYDGALFLNSSGYISESTGSCIFFIKNNSVYTPSIDCDILVGITRNRIIKICKLLNINLIESKILPSQLSQFESAFLAGTMIEIKPIKQINDLYFDQNNMILDLICKNLKKYVYGLGI